MVFEVDGYQKWQDGKGRNLFLLGEVLSTWEIPRIG